MIIHRSFHRSIISGVGLILSFCCGLVSAGESFITREQALAALFPEAEIHTETIFLTEAQIKEAQALSGEEITSALIARYVIKKEGRQIGRGYIDTHTVRTKKESLLIVLNANSMVKRIEITASQEPPEYGATPEWYRQYDGKILNEDLYIDRAIRPIAGATLTGRAANQAVRRIIAIDQVLERK